MLVIGAMLVLTACSQSQTPFADESLDEAYRTYERLTNPAEQLGERPEGSLLELTEFYLRTYQLSGSLPRVFQTTQILDRNGELLAELFEEGRRTWIPLSRISPHLIDATIATEDSSFYSNDGIDTRRFVGAALQNAEAQEVISGASTITMQLARNLFLPPSERFDQSVERKLLEIELAQELTKLLTKDEILEIYFNLLNYGHQSYGPEAASQLYFGKSAADLSPAEATLLAGIPQQPANYDLFLNFGAARDRQRIVLDLMVRHEYLSSSEADQIFAGSVELSPLPQPQPVLAPHFVNLVLDEVEQTMEQRLSPAPDERVDVRRSGLRIVTTLDLGLQRLAEKSVADGVARLSPRYGMSNGALVALMPSTGEILAMVGSADFFDNEIDGQVNVALSPRQPGSAIKPILYAAALEEGLISPASILWDLPVEYIFSSEQVYSPRNYDGRFRGPVSARAALANSYNVPAVKLIHTLGGDRMLEMSRSLGIDSLNQDASAYGLSLSLGAGEVTLLELTNAYRSFAGGGIYSQPLAVQQVTNIEGVTEASNRIMPVLAMSDATAFLITDILSDNQARTPAFGTNSGLRLSQPAAAKTGTTTDWRDNWTVGFTRYLVAGVWTGNNDGRPMRGSSGAAGAAPIWNAFMQDVLANPQFLTLLGAPQRDEGWNFEIPPSVQRVDECPPRVTCREGGEYFSQDWLAGQTEGRPLVDSLVYRATVPTHRTRQGASRWSSYCDPAGDSTLLADFEVRELLRLSGWVGMGPFGFSLDPESERTTMISSSDLAAEIADGSVVYYYPDSELEKYRLLAWSLGNRIPVYLGRCEGLNYYTVVPGDTWSSLARRVGLKMNELRAANPQAVRSNGYLQPGDRILLPAGIPLRTRDGSRFHIVEAGDSWSKIAAQYELPFRLLVAANPDLVRPDYLLRLGDRLMIPENVAIAETIQ